MNIAIDSTPLNNGHKYRGIGVYVGGLLSGFTHDERANITIISSGSNEDVNGYKQKKIIRPKYPKSSLHWLLNEFLLPYEIESLKIDLYHATDPNAILHSRKYITVASGYDLIPYIFKDIYEKMRIDNKVGYKKMLSNYKNVDHIIACSVATKNDFVNHLGIDKEKISVVPLAYDSNIFNNTEKKCNVNFKYFIYAGSIEERKNIKNALLSYKEIKNNVEENFILVGKKNEKERKELKEYAKKLGIEDRVFDLGYVTDHDLAKLYSNSTAFIFVSSYEGFGLPILEAMACGVPVVTSNVSSLPEVSGNAACLVDPTSIDEISKCMEKLSIDKRFREKKIDDGLEKAKEYTWRKTSNMTMEIYRKLCNN